MGKIVFGSSFSPYARRVIEKAQAAGSTAQTLRGIIRYFREHRNRGRLLRIVSLADRAAYEAAHYGRYKGDSVDTRAAYYAKYRQHRVSVQGVYVASYDIDEVMRARALYGARVTDIWTARLARLHTDVRARVLQLGARPIDVDIRQGMALVSRSRPSIGGWRYADERHLIGMDEGHSFAHRVPARICTVQQALDYMTPAIVRTPGAYVIRQGDIWAVGVPKDTLRAEVRGLDVLNGTRHYLRRRNERRDVATSPAVLRHSPGEHADVYLPIGYVWQLARSPRIDPHGRGGD